MNPGSLPPGDYYNIVFDPDNEQTGDFGNTGWGPDFPNAATVIAPLYTQLGIGDLSQVEDEAFEAKIDARARDARSRGAGQEVAGSRQGSRGEGLDHPDVLWLQPEHDRREGRADYRWPAYGSWPYAIMYVTP